MTIPTLLFNLFGSPDKHVDDWFGKTDSGSWNKDDQYIFDMLYGTQTFRKYFDYKLDMRTRKDYMKNTGLDYGDTNDPRKWPGAGSKGQLFGDVLNFVSDNVKRLYK